MHQREQGIGIAVVAQICQLLGVAARGPLVPQLAPATAPEHGLAALQRERQRLGAHPCHHKHLARVGVLHNAGDEPRLVVLQLGKIHLSS